MTFSKLMQCVKTWCPNCIYKVCPMKIGLFMLQWWLCKVVLWWEASKLHLFV